MNMWIARDEDGALALFVNERPMLHQDGRFDNFLGEYVTIDSDLFPEVTFENSPMEVELVIKK